MDIQPFAPRHQDQVVQLISGIQQGEFRLPVTPADQPDLMDIPGFYQRDGGNFWVALGQGRVVGTIALLDIGGGQGALRKMFVESARRGSANGVAKALLDTLCAWAAAHGIRDLFLGTTSRFLAAHRFYEKHGFARLERDGLPLAFPVMQVDTVFYRRHL